MHGRVFSFRRKIMSEIISWTMLFVEQSQVNWVLLVSMYTVYCCKNCIVALTLWGQVVTVTGMGQSRVTRIVTGHTTGTVSY